MLLKYFYNQKLAQASYMVGCQATGEALIVDPGRDIQMYLDAAAANGMRIMGATETHIHADFVSGARELAERTEATLYLSDEGDAEWKYRYLEGYAHQLLKDGDHFTVGNIRLEVMHTPGHTPEHLSFLLTDMGGGADRPMGIFTGDFVFVGSVGRPDLLEKAAGIADTSVLGAKQMYRSLQRFKELPDYLQVWPGHGAGSACGKGLGAIPSSTIGYEKLFNPALAYDNEADFIDYLLAEQPEPPTYFAVMKQVNKAGPDVLGALPTVERLDAAQLPQLLSQGAMVIDTRPSDAFAPAHLAGTINIPAPMLPAWTGWLVAYDKPFYLIIEPNELQDAVRDLIAIGLDQIGGYIEPSALQQPFDKLRDRQTQSYQTTTPQQIAPQLLNRDVTLVDVRSEAEWEGGHLPGATHIMLGYLSKQAHDVMNGKPIVVQCRSGARSAIAASILQAQGAKQVINMMGGYQAWARAGLPIER